MRSLTGTGTWVPGTQYQVRVHVGLSRPADRRVVSVVRVQYGYDRLRQRRPRASAATAAPQERHPQRKGHARGFPCMRSSLQVRPFQPPRRFVESPARRRPPHRFLSARPTFRQARGLSLEGRAGRGARSATAAEDRSEYHREVPSVAPAGRAETTPEVGGQPPGQVRRKVRAGRPAVQRLPRLALHRLAESSEESARGPGLQTRATRLGVGQGL